MITALFIDSREPLWVQELQFGDAPTTVTQLDAGDLMAACDDGAMLLIERKTPEDLLNTIKMDRLFPQIQGMLLHTRWAYLVITEPLLHGPNGEVVTRQGNTGWKWASVQGE